METPAGDATYESIIAGAPDAAAAEVAPPVAPEPSTQPAEEAWQGPSQQEWEQTQGYLQQTAPFLNELQSLLAEPDPYQQPQEQQQFDPGNPDAYLEQRLEQMWQERFGAYEPVLGQIAEREGEQMARSTLDRLASEHGEFDRDLALTAAQVYVDPERGGMSPADALNAAAQFARQTEERIRADERAKYTTQLGNAANAPTDIHAPGAAVEAPGVPTGRDRYEQAVANFTSRMNPTLPTG
jgi:hypothetical protein